MKKQLNEVKRMQLLAGLITESQLSEVSQLMPASQVMPKVDEIAKKLNIFLVPEMISRSAFTAKVDSLKGDFSSIGDKEAIIAAIGDSNTFDGLLCYSKSDDITNPKDSFKLIQNFYEVLKKEFPSINFKDYYSNRKTYDVKGEKVVVGSADITNFTQDTVAKTTIEEDITKPVPSDVKALSNVQKTATAVSNKAKAINSIQEFPGAFENWFQTLGFQPGKISKSILRAEVEKVLVKLGYK
jgi:hypothetical protein